MIDKTTTGHRIWCHGPKPEFEADADWADQWYVGARTLPLVRSQDLIVLPGGNEPTQQFARFCCRMLGLEETQIIWTSGRSYLMDDDIRMEQLPAIARAMGEDEDWTLVPYSVTAPFTRWANELRAKTFGDEQEWVIRHGTKGILHPRADGAAHPDVPLLSQEVPGIRVARGYSALGPAELLMAHERLIEDGVSSFVVKPMTGTTGEGIIFLDEPTAAESLRQYTFPMGPVVLEEKLHTDHDPDSGQCIAPSVQYAGSHVLGRPTVQLMQGAAFSGARLTADLCPRMEEEILEMTERILAWLKPKGPGGLDFLSVQGRPVLIDPNIGRFTGVHPARLFAGLYAPGASWICWKVNPKKNIWDFWHELEQDGIAFAPGRSTIGVFPLCYLPGMWGMLIAFGPKERHAALCDRANACL